VTSEPLPVTTAPDRHPIGLIVTDDLGRSRLTVFFRLILAIPHLIFVYLWGLAAGFAVLFAWFAALFTRRVPLGLHDFIAGYLRYAARVFGYTLLLAEPFPPFGSGGSYPIDARVDGPQEQSRPTVFFRLVLAIPALILAGVFRNVNGAIAFIAWFYCLVVGSMNESLRDLSAWLLRFELQTYGYVMLLTQRYPSLAGAPTA
jgi:hypothetical protein